VSGDERALFAAVCAAPDDDAPRLAYADFIAASDPAQAELIRLQIQRATLDRRNKTPSSRPTGREHELLVAHGNTWGRYLQKFVRRPRGNALDPLDQGFAFVRGFIAFVRMEPENFVGLGQRLFDMAPVQHADLYGGEDPVRPLFASPLLARLHSLSLAGAGLDDDDAIALAGCDALRGCAWLDLSNNRIGRRGVEALARSSMMANKVTVLMRGNPCNPIENVRVDTDGSIADGVLPPVAKEIEASMGRVEWFHFGWDNVGDQPDRYYAKWVGRQ
jgi:uncharacterized protein (TIGR02996 family)